VSQVLTSHSFPNARRCVRWQKGSRRTHDFDQSVPISLKTLKLGIVFNRGRGVLQETVYEAHPTAVRFVSVLFEPGGSALLRFRSFYEGDRTELLCGAQVPSHKFRVDALDPQIHLRGVSLLLTQHLIGNQKVPRKVGDFGHFRGDGPSWWPLVSW